MVSVANKWHADHALEALSGNVYKFNSVSRSKGRRHVCYYRPIYHVTPPQGWLNDPCAPYYDRSRGMYHVFFQWNPKSLSWGDITWGHFQSSDMVHWQLVGSGPALAPAADYDQKGIFSGCYGGKDLGATQDMIFYTSASHLPISYDLPYVRGCETLSVALSDDDGNSWSRVAHNPILPGPPKDLNVGAWRDPFIFSSTALDRLRNTTRALYAIISGCEIDRGPTVFLYVIDQTDRTRWGYCGTVASFGKGFFPSTKWSGDYGASWEMVNFVSLRDHDQSKNYDFFLLGSEGCRQRFLASDSKPSSRTNRWSLWYSGEFRAENDGFDFPYNFGGVLDHGTSYAANTFWDPISNATVLWAWLPDEDLEEEEIQKQGWNGCFVLPRELFLQKTRNIRGSICTSIAQVEPISLIKEPDGSTSAITLGIRPANSLRKLRKKLVNCMVDDLSRSVPKNSLLLYQDLGNQWELEATIFFKTDTGRFGFYLQHDHIMSSYSSLCFSPRDEELVLDRSKSNSNPRILKTPEQAPHTLFLAGPSGTDLEPLRLRVFRDGHVLEIFANERTVISTRVYSDSDDARSISFFAQGDPKLRDVSLWSLY